MSRCIIFVDPANIPQTPLYLYLVEAPVIRSLTNMGKPYPDVYRTTEQAIVRLQEHYEDWQDAF